eukprot:282429-Amphidinium_carterae.1
MSWRYMQPRQTTCLRMVQVASPLSFTYRWRSSPSASSVKPGVVAAQGHHSQHALTRWAPQQLTPLQGSGQMTRSSSHYPQAG